MTIVAQGIMRPNRYFSRLPEGVTRRQIIVAAGDRHHATNRAFTHWFNIAASAIMVALASGVMAWLISSDPDSAFTFAPFFVVILFLIGGFAFAGRQGRWITAKVMIQMFFIFAVLPLTILLYASLCANIPSPGGQHNQTFLTNSPPQYPVARDPALRL
jgi:hypothetical protein